MARVHTPTQRVCVGALCRGVALVVVAMATGVYGVQMWAREQVFFLTVRAQRRRVMKKTKEEGGAKGKAATEAVDEDKLYSFNYDEQMSVRETRPWKKDPK